MSHPRVEEELTLLKGRYPNLVYRPEGDWVKIPEYKLPPGWNRDATDVAFHIVPPPGAPYGIFVPAGLQFRGQRPNNYTEPAQGVPFEGQWGQFSWSPDAGAWVPGSTAASGSNYVNWAIGFSDRFREGI